MSNARKAAMTKAGLGAAASLVLSAVLSMNLLGQSRTVDWRVYGTFTVGAVLDILFYDAADIIRVADGRLDVSVKGMSTPQIDSIEADEATLKRLMDRATVKTSRGIKIPEWLTKGLGNQRIASLTVAEEAANVGGLDPILRGTYEIDCNQRLIRVLALAFAQGDKTDSYTSPGGWNPVKPESNNGMLLRSVCQ